jgi:hypothetical protein
MTVYAPTGTTAISVGAGCGASHAAERELVQGEHFAVTCPACESLILATKTGWSSDVRSVALTPDERAYLDAQEKEGQRAQAIATRALAQRLGDLTRLEGMATTAAPVDPVQDVLSKLAVLNDDQLAALRAVFAPADAPKPAKRSSKKTADAE